MERYSIIACSAGCHTAARLAYRNDSVDKVVLVSGYSFVNARDIEFHERKTALTLYFANPTAHLYYQ